MNQIEDLEKLAALHTSGVLTDDEFSRAKARIVTHLTEPADPNKAPAWMKPWGQYTFIFSAFALAVIAVCRLQTQSDSAVLVEILLNPLFFIGLPLGFYWIYRGDQATREKI